MMRLSTLWRVDATVDGTGSSPIAERVAEPWEHERGSVRFFRSSANFLYVSLYRGRRYFLRFADSSERSKEAIEAEVDILQWLARAGIRVATPVPARTGNLVETVETDQGILHAVAFPALHGLQLDMGDLNLARFKEWGAALGRLHAALKDYSGAGRSARVTWHDHLHLAREAIADDLAAIRGEWEEIWAALSALPVDSKHYGLCHFDFELDNLVWDDHSVGILDFDDCSLAWYAMDVAFALRQLFEQDVDLSHAPFREFVHGYTQVCPLDEKSIGQIPLFLRMANLLLYARIARALDLPEGQTFPDWLTSLQRKLQHRCEVYRASLLNRRS